MPTATARWSVILALGAFPRPKQSQPTPLVNSWFTSQLQALEETTHHFPVFCCLQLCERVFTSHKPWMNYLHQRNWIKTRDHRDRLLKRHEMHILLWHIAQFPKLDDKKENSSWKMAVRALWHDICRFRCLLTCGIKTYSEIHLQHLPFSLLHWHILWRLSCWFSPRNGKDSNNHNGTKLLQGCNLKTDNLPWTDIGTSAS